MEVVLNRPVSMQFETFFERGCHSNHLPHDPDCALGLHIT